MVQGYSINQQRFDQNAETLQQASQLKEKAAQSPELSRDGGQVLVEVKCFINSYAHDVK